MTGKPSEEERRRRLRERERRRRLTAAFGDPLPEQTRDEGAAGWGEDAGVDPGAGDAGEEWLRSQVPPHHE